MSEHFRKPFMVESVRQYPGGVSDPEHSTFRTLAEARDHAEREEHDGAFATVYRRTLDDDYEEVAA